MRILKVAVGILITVLLCQHFSGCASFKKNQLNTVGVLPPLSSENKKQTLTYTFTSWVDDGHLEREKNRERIFEDEFTSILKDSGYFSMLEPGDDRDIRIQAVLLVSYSGSLASVGTGLTSCRHSLDGCRHRPYRGQAGWPGKNPLWRGDSGLIFCRPVPCGCKSRRCRD